MQDITVRRMAFEYPETLDPLIIPGEPEESYTLIGLSLLLPYLEPYLIRTMNEAKRHIDDPDLLADLARFNAQEGQHYREHIRFNQALRASGFAGIEPLEKELDADYRRFSETRSLRFNLGYAEGFEALTTATARFHLSHGGLDRNSPAGRLFTWHAVEELEHRTVAFDVYDRVCGGYVRRLGIGLFAQWHMLRFVVRVTRAMIDASPEVMARLGGRAGMRERARRQRREGRRLLPSVLRTYLPGYTPHDIPFTEEMRRLAQEFTAIARSTSLDAETPTSP